MVVRGAPAIGIAAAYAVVLGLRARLQQTKRNYFTRGLALDSTLNHFFLHEELNLFPI